MTIVVASPRWDASAQGIDAQAHCSWKFGAPDGPEDLGTWAPAATWAGTPIALEKRQWIRGEEREGQGERTSNDGVVEGVSEVLEGLEVGEFLHEDRTLLWEQQLQDPQQTQTRTIRPHQVLSVTNNTQGGG